MDCARCGLNLETPHIDGLWYEDDDIKCTGCATVNHISVDGGNEPDDGDEGGVGSAYVSSWTCTHGINGDSPCDVCETEGDNGTS